MVPMCGGVMLCTAGELNFNMIGFVAVVSATLLRGVKSIIQVSARSFPVPSADCLHPTFCLRSCHCHAAREDPLCFTGAVAHHAGG